MSLSGALQKTHLPRLAFCPWMSSAPALFACGLAQLKAVEPAPNQRDPVSARLASVDVGQCKLATRDFHGLILCACLAYTLTALPLAQTASAGSGAGSAAGSAVTPLVAAVFVAADFRAVR